MSPTQLKFLLSSSAENLIRLQSVLERRRVLGSAPEFDAIILAMLDRCGRYRAYYLEHATIINKVLQNEPLNPVEEIALKILFRNCINTFFVLHELLLFLPRESIRKEMHYFCKELFRPQYDSAELSIILTSVYNAFEYSLDAAIRSLDVVIMKVPDPKKLDFGHVMELAIIDRDNPLSWSVLAHEFGHYLDQKAQISRPLAIKFVDEQIKPPADVRPALEKLFVGLASEVLADLTSYYLLGPVSILPVINMELNFRMATDKPISFDGVHPFTTTRLQVITEVAAADQMTLSLFGAYIEALREDEESKVAKLSPDKQEERKQIKQFTELFAQGIRDSLLQSIAQFDLSRFSSPNLATAEELKGTLNKGVPIGSRRLQGDAEIQSALSQLKDTSTLSECRTAFEMLKEAPVSVAEVLAAGWIANAEKKVVLLRDAFSHQNNDDVFPSMQKDLEAQDHLLMKSIEMISVVREVNRAPK
jgi:hypothetical protein